jgi:hypothetical protein
MSVKTADKDAAERAAEVLRAHGADRINRYQPAL